jgi:signal transduction histidine kinase
VDGFAILSKSGQEKLISWHNAVINNERDEVAGILRSGADITYLRRFEEERRVLEQKAQLASRLASVGELASGVAHEINNPLTGVIGYSQLLLERQDTPKDIRQDLKVINEGAQRVASIVKRLLAFARQTKPARTHVDINDLINGVLQLREYNLKANNITVTTTLDPALPITMADAGQLQQVFLNLIINAETEMKLAHNKGKLRVTTGKVDSNIVVAFKDNGPGIPEDNLQKIFDPFFTTREVSEGTGLGLSVCYGIIKEHNGRIWADSEPGRGATFFVELPVVASEAIMQKPEAGKIIA